MYTSHSTGQFWNIPIQVTPFTYSNGTVVEDVFTIAVSHPDGSMRRFTGWHYPVTWEFLERPCLYVGNGQGGPIDEIEDPNDSVIEGTYVDYKVESAFDTSHMFSHFDEANCPPPPVPTIG